MFRSAASRLARTVVAKPAAAARTRVAAVPGRVALAAQSSRHRAPAAPALRAYTVSRLARGKPAVEAPAPDPIPGQDDKDMKNLVGKYLQRDVKPSQRPEDPEDYFYVRSKQQLEKGNIQEAYGVHPDAGALGAAGAMAKYGVIPTIGLGMAALISKELFILDEEVLILACFGTFVGSVYITQGQAIKDAVEEQVAGVRHNMEAYYDALIDTMVAQIEFYEENFKLKEEVMELYNCYKETNEKFIATRKNGLIKALNESVEKELEHLAELEARRLDECAVATASSARDFVQKKVTSDPKLREQYLDASIQMISSLGATGGERAVVNDPLINLYVDYCADLKKKFEDRKKSGVQLTETQFNELREWADKKEAFLNSDADLADLKKQFPEEARNLVQPALDSMMSERKSQRKPFKLNVPRTMPFQW